MLPVASEQGSNMRYRHLDFFIRVGRWQKFKNPGNSLVDGENPLEIFLFLDAPGVKEEGVMDTGSGEVGATVTNMTLEACFRS